MRARNFMLGSYSVDENNPCIARGPAFCICQQLKICRYGMNQIWEEGFSGWAWFYDQILSLILHLILHHISCLILTENLSLMEKCGMSITENCPVRPAGQLWFVEDLQTWSNWQLYKTGWLVKLLRNPSSHSTPTKYPPLIDWRLILHQHQSQDIPLRPLP